MAFTRLVPHFYVFTPFGVAEVHFLETPDGFETNSVWTCFQVETKECWQWPTPMIRLCESISGIRDGECTDFGISPDYFETLRPHILRHKLSPLYERAIMGSSSQNIRQDIENFGRANNYPKDWMADTKATLEADLRERGIRPQQQSRVPIMVLVALMAIIGGGGLMLAAFLPH